MTKIIQTQQVFAKKPGTKTVWLSHDKETKEVSEDTYKYYVDAAPFFRRLGGSVTQSKGYTSCGYLVTRDVTTNPDKTIKKVTEWSFEYVGGERA